MNKSFSPWVIAAIVLSLCSAVFSLYLRNSQTRIGFVRSLELLEGYKGTIEAKAKFDKTKETMMSNVDSMKIDYNRASVNLGKLFEKLPPAQQKDEAAKMDRRREQLVQYNGAIEQRIQEESTKMTTGVLKRVNAYIDDYAKKNGYDVIIGTTANGNLLYGNSKLDLTDVILNGLNTDYVGTPAQ